MFKTLIIIYLWNKTIVLNQLQHCMLRCCFDDRLLSLKSVFVGLLFGLLLKRNFHFLHTKPNVFQVFQTVCKKTMLCKCLERVLPKIQLQTMGSSTCLNWKKKKFRKWNCWHRCRIVRVLCCSRKLSLSNTKRCYYNRRFGWWMLLATCANRSFFNDFSRAHDHTRQSTNVVRRCQSLRVLRRIWCYSGEFYLLNVSKTKQKKNMKFSKKKNSTIRQQLQIQLDRTMLNCLLIIIQQILHHIVQQLELLDFGMYGFFKKYFLAVTFSQ